MLPKKLQVKLDARKKENSFRELGTAADLIDFSSNDYLGFSQNKEIYKRSSEILTLEKTELNGATGSRLLTGNHKLYETAESEIAQFHSSEAALIFNSGYDANLGFFSCVPQRGDIILYDELCHASIRDGIKLSLAKSYKFKHNDLDDLETKCQVERDTLSTSKCSRNLYSQNEIYIVTESVFSMDGDQPDLKKLVSLSKKYNFNLVVDEAHALGILGDRGEGLVQQLGLENQVFARLVTFGKALGCHGAAILGSNTLKEYLVNFARSLIYTTALPPHAVATIIAGYEQLQKTSEVGKLKKNIQFFKKKIKDTELQEMFITSNSPIQSCLIPGNDWVKKDSALLKSKGFDVKPILSPTVPKGKERLRICLHSFNTEKHIQDLMLSIKETL